MKLARSFLFVPADRPDRIGKALASGADGVIVDLEDAIALDAKEQARDALAGWLAGASDRVWVRINATGTPWFDADVALCAQPAIAGVMLPKAEEAAQLDSLARRVPGKPLLPLVETAAGLDNARSIAAATAVERLAFGTLDFQLDLGLQSEAESLLVHRAQLVLASRLAGCAAPVDGVSTSLDDLESLRADAERARRLGFAGKLCIHPRQVDVVNRCFSPTADELAWARRVVEAVRRAGRGAVAVDGRMVDRPVILRAEALLARAPHEPPGSTRG